LLYAATFHLLAGTVAGSIFKVRTLLTLLGFVLFETAIAAIVQGSSAGLWALTSLLAIEVGYMAGLLSRGALGLVGYSGEQAGTRRPR